MHDIAKMAILSGVTYEEMIGYIDFFMNDRSGDGEVMLNELGIDEKKRLKCNAHVVLATDVALDKVFRDIETKVGPAKLIGQGASHVFGSPSNSIWYLGLLAIAKLFSPSHCTESICLYTDYMRYLRENPQYSNLHQFKGFVSNRFGRIGELSNLFLDHEKAIDAFFNNQVDEHSNKLVLAVSCYYNSEWFKMCFWGSWVRVGPLWPP